MPMTLPMRNPFDCLTSNEWPYYIVRDRLDEIWNVAGKEGVLVRLTRRRHASLIVLTEWKWIDVMRTIDRGARLRVELERVQGELTELLEDIR